MRQRADPKHAWITLGAVFAASLVLIAQSYNQFLAENRELADETAVSALRPRDEGYAWIELDFGGGRRRMFEGEVGSAAYSLESGLRAASAAGNFTYTVRKGVIKEIAGVQTSFNGIWRIYRNSALVQEMLDAMTLAQGDTYTFRYEP